MDLRLLAEFEKAVISWNSVIKHAIRHGQPAAKVRHALERAKIGGETELLVALYSWRDGVLPEDIDIFENKKGMFPGEPYVFLDMEMAIGHLGHCGSAARTHPELSEGVGRYFPIFWNGSVSWIGVDLAPGNQNRVMLMQHRSTPVFRQAYRSFDDFLSDAIQACLAGRPLTCFQSTSQRRSRAARRPSHTAARLQPEKKRANKKLTYFVSDGGPHLLLPDSVRSDWKGLRT